MACSRSGSFTPWPAPLYYSHRGRISARDVHDQMNACSCRILIFACIDYRQAREISRIAAATDFPFDPGHIARINLIQWKDVILGDEIRIDPARSGVRSPWRAFLYKSGSYPCWRKIPAPTDLLRAPPWVRRPAPFAGFRSATRSQPPAPRKRKGQSVAGLPFPTPLPRQTSRVPWHQVHR